MGDRAGGGEDERAGRYGLINRKARAGAGDRHIGQTGDLALQRSIAGGRARQLRRQQRQARAGRRKAQIGAVDIESRRRTGRGSDIADAAVRAAGVNEDVAAGGDPRRTEIEQVIARAIGLGGEAARAIENLSNRHARQRRAAIGRIDRAGDEARLPQQQRIVTGDAGPNRAAEPARQGRLQLRRRHANRSAGDDAPVSGANAGNRGRSHAGRLIVVVVERNTGRRIGGRYLVDADQAAHGHSATAGNRASGIRTGNTGRGRVDPTHQTAHAAGPSTRAGRHRAEGVTVGNGTG